jgi:hypothetical protein
MSGRIKKVNYRNKLDRADNIYICGPSTCGKGYTAKKLTRKDTRLVIFDIPEDWEEASTIIRNDIKALARAMEAPRFRIAFLPNTASGQKALALQFDQYCRVVMAIGRCRSVVDELNDVTMPGYAPGPWRNLLKRGRHRGVHNIGISHRPAETDKAIITNATEIIAGRMDEPADIRPLRSRMGPSMAAQLPGLELRQMLHWKAGQIPT